MRIHTFAKAALLIALFTVLSFTLQNSPATQGEFCRKMVVGNIDKIREHLIASTRLLNTINPGSGPTDSLKIHYRQARKYFKEIEFFVEYYSPFDAKYYINGPLVPKVEVEISNTPFEPRGFQVIEELLFDAAKTDQAALINEYRFLSDNLAFLKNYYSDLKIEDNKLDEALKLQLIRIMCLTLNGYDCTINKESIAETSHSLAGIETLLRNELGMVNDPASKKILKNVLRLIAKNRKLLERHPDSDSFNRLDFIASGLHPVYQEMIRYSHSKKMEASLVNYAVNFNAGSFFKTNSIHKQYFSVYLNDTIGLDKQAGLGALLFYDPVLSGNNLRACASCHRADKAFTDGLDKSTGYDRIHRLTRNSPTLVNAGYQKLYFHDGRIFNLEGQADAVFNNTFEMNTSAGEIVEKLKERDDYRRLFREAFKTTPDSSLTFYGVIKSITEFIKTLDSRNSRLDDYLRGNKKALTRQEKNGFNLFHGKALCGSCHFFPLFNGTVPPMYNDNEFEVLGVPETENGNRIDPDRGREVVSGSEIQRYAFKTPTLRNVALTAPYMHNGSYASLDSVLTFYNRGGGLGSGILIHNQTLPFDSLGLSKSELNDLKLFLLALTDTSSLPKKPVRLPAFKNDLLNHRKIGGEY